MNTTQMVLIRAFACGVWFGVQGFIALVVLQGIATRTWNVPSSFLLILFSLGITRLTFRVWMNDKSNNKDLEEFRLGMTLFPAMIVIGPFVSDLFTTISYLKKVYPGEMILCLVIFFLVAVVPFSKSKSQDSANEVAPPKT